MRWETSAAQTRHRPRVVRVQEGAFRVDDLERLEGAGAERDLGEDVAHGEVHRGVRRGEHRVHRAAAGRARAREVEHQAAVPGAGDGELDDERLVDDAVGIEEGPAAVGTRREASDALAHLHRRADAQLGDGAPHRPVAVTVQHLAEPLLADAQRRVLGHDVADALLGDAHVREDHRVELGVELAALEQLDGRETQALLLDRRRRGREAARHRAADIGPVADVRQPAEHLSGPEHRHREAHVHQVRAAEVGVVDGVDVARRRWQGRALADALDQRARGVGHRADEDRQAAEPLGDQRAVPRRRRCRRSDRRPRR